MKIPRTLGRYEVVDLIGRGGMGALYRARDPRIGRYVAIKLLRRDFDTPELRDRFSREARAAGGLSHPNIVTIYDVGEDDGLPFIAMEYVRGETFVDLLGLRPPLSVARKLQLTEEVCAGLGHAHEAGIVHRDIKPANLIVSSEGIVKILDFGIAKLSDSQMTIRGTVMGTLNYMSPEQITGAAVDARTDIFAVGTVLYELLSHQPAFPGGPGEVFDRIVNGAPTPLAEYCPDIDPRLVRVVDRALEKDPNRRYQHIALLQKELTSIRLSPAAPEARSAGAHSVSSTGPAPSIAGSVQATRRATPIPAVRELTRLREQQIEEHLAAAARAFAAADYDAAIESCKRVLMLDPSEDRAIARLDLIHAAMDAQHLAAAAAEEHERQEEARIRSAVEDARRRFANGEHQAALHSLAALPSSHALVASARDELQIALRQLEEQHALQERADRCLAEFDEQLAQNELPRAAGLLENAFAIAPNDSRLVAARERLHAATAALAAKEAAEARSRDGEQKLAEAAANLEQGNLADAESLLKVAAELVPQHSRLAELAEQLRDALERRAAAEAAERRRQRIAELLARASQRFQAAGDQKTERSAALSEVDEALALDPHNADAQSLKRAIEESIAAHREAARVNAAINNARTRFMNGKHQAALRLLEEFRPPSHPEIVAALSELRGKLAAIEGERRAERERLEKQEKIGALLADARTALQEERFDAAQNLLAQAAEIDATAPELSQLTERARQQQAAARLRTELDRLLAASDECVTRGDLQGASELLTTATGLNPGDARVQQARQRVEEATAAQAAAEARRRELEEKLAAAEELVAHGDLHGASQALKAAAGLDAHHPRVLQLSERIEEGIKKQEIADAAARVREMVDELLAAAAEQLQSADEGGHSVTTAMQKIKRALALLPDHAGALALKAKADEMYAAERQVAFIRAAVRNARSRFANGKHQAAIQLLESLGPTSDPLVADTLKELREELRLIQERNAAVTAAEGPKETAEHGSEEDEAATRIMVVSADLHERQPPDDGKERLVRGATATHGTPELSRTNDMHVDTVQPAKATGHPWRWGLIVTAAALLLLVVLAALFGLK